MHCLAMHTSQFLELHSNLGMFNQQGLEKLNDFTTVHFQHASNHREQEALTQILEKRNRLEELKQRGHQRARREKKCSYVSKQVTTRKHVLLICNLIHLYVTKYYSIIQELE